MLANEYVAEVGKSPQMDLSGAVEAELPCHVPGFEGFRVSYFPDRFGPGVMRNKFGKSFGMAQREPLASCIARLTRGSPQNHM